LRQIGILLNPHAHTLRFNLAYQLAERESPSRIALFHYSELQRRKSDQTHANNNIALIYDAISAPSSANHAFTLAVRDKNDLSIANLAKKLITDGYIDQGEELLQLAGSSGDHHDAVLSARLHLTQALKKRSEDETKIIAKSSALHRIFARFSERSRRFWIAYKGATPSGKWASADGSHFINNDSAKNILSINIGGTNISGEMKFHNFCASAYLTEHSNALLSVNRRDALITWSNDISTAYVIVLGSVADGEWREFSLAKLVAE
jgi:hypothetical protein